MNTASALDPARTALLVLDFQPAVLAALPEGAEREGLLARVAGAVAEVRAAGGTVAYVRAGFTEADWAAIPAANKAFAPLAQHRAMHEEDPATAIHERLAPEQGDIVVRKTRFGAFSTTDLDRQLRERGITALVLAGVTTSGAVLSAVVEAADRDYSLHVLADGCAAPDAEVHEVLVRKVFPARAHVIDADGLRGLLGAG